MGQGTTDYASRYTGAEVEEAIRVKVRTASVINNIHDNDPNIIYIITQDATGGMYDKLCHQLSNGTWRELGALPSETTQSSKIILSDKIDTGIDTPIARSIKIVGNGTLAYNLVDVVYDASSQTVIIGI